MILGDQYSNVILDVMSIRYNRKNQEDKIELFKFWSFSKKNYMVFGLGLAFIIFGYIIMGIGTVNSFQSLTLAPIFLFIGYIILIPISIIYHFK